jgi:hypothetical protein
MAAGEVWVAGAHDRIIEEGKGQAGVRWREGLWRSPSPSAFIENGTDPGNFGESTIPLRGRRAGQNLDVLSRFVHWPRSRRW